MSLPATVWLCSIGVPPIMKKFATKIVDLLIALRIPLFLAAVALAAAAFWPARGIEFDRSVENMFAPGDPLLKPYVKLKRTFGGNEIALAVYADDDFLEPDARGIRRLAELRRKLNDVPGVRSALSLDQPLGVEEIVDPDNRVAGWVRKQFQGYTHSADGRIAAVICMLEPESEPGVPPRRTTIDELRSIVRTLPSGMIAGEPVMIADGFQYIEQDGRRLGWASTLLLGAVIIVCFRSLRWVIVPVAVVQFTLLLTKATLVLSGLRLSMVSSMLTAIVTVVGIATVIHIIVRFREARLDGWEPRQALSAAGRLLIGPVFWACSTTAVGFASLTVSEIGPIQDFGIMMALGALFVLISVAMVLPALVLTGRIDTDPKLAWGERFLDSGLDRSARLALRRPKTVGAVTLLAALAAASGAYRLEVETDFTRNFRSTSPIVASYEFVESHMGGAGVWDIILPAENHLEWSYLKKVDRLERRLRKEVVVSGPEGQPEPGLTKVLSLVESHSLAKVARMPGRDVLVRKGIERVKLRMPALVEAQYGEDPQEPGTFYYRIMLRSKERQPSAEKRSIIHQVETIARQEFPAANNKPGAEVTGFFVLLTNLIDSMLRDQWEAFGVATAGIGLMMLVAFRSPRLAAVTLVPNVLPILVVTGLMGWAGLKINMGAAMIAAVSMGLSIDSSIHYVTAFRRARREGRSIDDALTVVQKTVGRAMVFSTVALIVGFTVLATSQFVPTVYFGVLVSLAMAGGLAGNLILLPVLLKLTGKAT